MFGGCCLVVFWWILVFVVVVWDVLVLVVDWFDWGLSVLGVCGVDGGIEVGSCGEVCVVGVWVLFSIEMCDDEFCWWMWCVVGVLVMGYCVDLVGFE